VIERFEAGEPALGIFADNLNPRNAVDLGSSQLDFVMIDMEHGPLDFERLESFVLATTNKRRILSSKNRVPSRTWFPWCGCHRMDGSAFSF